MFRFFFKKNAGSEEPDENKKFKLSEYLLTGGSTKQGLREMRLETLVLHFCSDEPNRPLLAFLNPNQPHNRLKHDIREILQAELISAIIDDALGEETLTPADVLGKALREILTVIRDTQTEQRGQHLNQLRETLSKKGRELLDIVNHSALGVHPRAPVQPSGKLIGRYQDLGFTFLQSYAEVCALLLFVPKFVELEERVTQLVSEREDRLDVKFLTPGRSDDNFENFVDVRRNQLKSLKEEFNSVVRVQINEVCEEFPTDDIFRHAIGSIFLGEFPLNIKLGWRAVERIIKGNNTNLRPIFEWYLRDVKNEAMLKLNYLLERIDLMVDTLRR